MAAEPRVSVVVGAYNAEATIAEAIESALGQDHRSLDVVVVDDASTDGTAAIVARFGDRVRVVLRTENGGQSVAYNQAWRATHGDVVIFLDGDDVLERHAASTVARHWRPGLVKLQFQLTPIDERGRVIGPAYPDYPSGLDTAKMRRLLLTCGSYPSVPACGNAYARTFLERRGGLPGLAWWDLMLEVDAPFFGDVATLQQPLARKREHAAATSLTATIAPERFVRLRALFEGQIRYLAARCRWLGLPFDRDAVLARSAWFQDLELVIARLAPDRVDRGARRILPRALLATLLASDTPRKKALLLGWEVLVALAPAPLAERAIGWRFLPASRPWQRLGSVPFASAPAEETASIVQERTS